MKRTFLFIILCLCYSFTQAQLVKIEKINLPATGEDFGIYTDIDVDNNLKDLVVFDLQALNPEQRARARLNYGDFISLISSMQKAKEIYKKWSQIAQQKGYKLFSKKIPTSFSDLTIDFTDGGKWHTEDGVDICSVFFVDEKGKSFFVLKSDYMTSSEVVGSSSSSGSSFSFLPTMAIGALGFGSSSSVLSIGRYCGGSTLTFSSVAEIDKFIEKLQFVLDWKGKNVSINKELKK